MKYVIKPMLTDDEIEGKGYVHYKSWQETYAGLIDAAYLKRMTEEKCRATAWSREYAKTMLSLSENKVTLTAAM